MCRLTLVETELFGHERGVVAETRGLEYLAAGGGRAERNQDKHPLLAGG